MSPILDLIGSVKSLGFGSLSKDPAFIGMYYHATEFSGSGAGVGADSAGNLYSRGRTNNFDFYHIKANSFGSLQNTQRVYRAGETYNSMEPAAAQDIISCQDGYIRFGVSYYPPDGAQALGVYGLTASALGSFTLSKALDISSPVSSEILNGMHQDSSGNYYICGYSARGLSPAFSYGWLYKYNSSFTLQWSRQFNEASQSSGRDPYRIKTDPSGNVYVYSFDNGFTQPLIHKFNSSGTLQWTYRLSGLRYPSDFHVSASGNIYLVADFSNSGYASVVVTKLDSSATVQWARQITRSAIDITSRFMAVDANENVYVAGATTIPTDKASVDIYKWNSSGTIQWQRNFSNNNNAKGIYMGNIIVTGKSFVLGAYGQTPGAVGMYLIKLPQDGSLTGSYTVGGSTFTYAAASGTTEASRSVTLTSVTLSPGNATPAETSTNIYSTSLAMSSATVAV